MRFGVFYELQLPKPWARDDEFQLVQDALAQVELADRLGIDYAWAVEHHFLEEYSHCSASEVFLAAAAARTRRIRLGHGIRQVIANYNHPARTAESIAMLDLISNGRAEFGIGEGATRLELGGFNIPAKEKRAMALEAAEQIANMMVMTPYPGFEGRSFKMPCRNVLPKPRQSPHEGPRALEPSPCCSRRPRTPRGWPAAVLGRLVSTRRSRRPTHALAFARLRILPLRRCLGSTSPTVLGSQPRVVGVLNRPKPSARRKPRMSGVHVARLAGA